MLLRVWLAGLAAVALLAAGCGGSGPKRGAHHATVSVLYAGSLVNMMENDLGPAFARVSGYGYEGVGAGSTELVAQIKGKIRQGDVFISASPTADDALEGSANGDYVRWYATFAKAPLVIGYDPHSAFASQFRTEPWYRVIAEHGIRVGATDPRLDPKGKLTVAALEQASVLLHRPSLAKAPGAFQIFPEESLVGRLEAGQLDAGFFYSNEAKEQHIPTVPITPVKASATYTVTILRGAPDPSGARAFVTFLLSRAGRATLARYGLTVLTPTWTGSRSAVPSGLRRLAGAG